MGVQKEMCSLIWVTGPYLANPNRTLDCLEIKSKYSYKYKYNRVLEIAATMRGGRMCFFYKCKRKQ